MFLLVLFFGRFLLITNKREVVLRDGEKLYFVLYT